MKIKIRQQLANRKGQILRRLDKSKLGDCSQPVLVAPGPANSRRRCFALQTLFANLYNLPVPHYQNSHPWYGCN